MLERVYEVISDKNLSFGCKVVDPAGQVAIILKKTTRDRNWVGWEVWYISGCDGIGKEDYSTGGIGYIHESVDIKVIGHEVMFGDVCDYCKQKYMIAKVPKLSNLWTKLREPISKQTEECKAYVTSLLPETTTQG